MCPTDREVLLGPARGKMRARGPSPWTPQDAAN